MSDVDALATRAAAYIRNNRRVLNDDMLDGAVDAVMQAVRRCDEKPDDSGHCSCARFVRYQIEHYAQFGAARAIGDLLPDSPPVCEKCYGRGLLPIPGQKIVCDCQRATESKEQRATVAMAAADRHAEGEGR